MTWIEISGLIIAGFLAGVINILAGSGSVFTLGIMSLIGIPGTIANGSNRLGILLFGITGSYKFYQKKELDIVSSWKHILFCTIGAVVGAYVGTLVSNKGFEWVLALIFLAFIYVLWKQPEKSWKVSNFSKPVIPVIMFLIGIYGGFIQVGTGIFLLVILKMILAEKFQQLNPLKVFIITLFNLLAFGIYWLGDMVNWEAAIALSIGQILGALLGVRFNRSKLNLEQPIRYFLMLICGLSAIKLWFF
jgi:hypothetical protein